MNKDEIKRRREQLGLTQQELAKEMQISRVTLARWEVGKFKPNRLYAMLLYQTLRRLSAAHIKKLAAESYPPMTLDISLEPVHS